MTSKNEMKKFGTCMQNTATLSFKKKKTKAMQEHEKCTNSNEDSDTECETTDNNYTRYDTKTRC